MNDRPIIENSDRGITLNKSLAWSVGCGLIDVAYRLPAGDHTLTMTGDGDPVAVDLLIIDGA